MINYLLIFIFGAIFGSFISALTYRIPNSLSFVKGRSICPKCKKQIAWHDNIPLLSFLLLGGKCRKCKKKISLRYPIIEASTAIGFVFIAMQGLTLHSLIFHLIIFVILEAIFIIDLEHQIIPDSLIFTGLVVTIISYQFAFSNEFSVFSYIFAGFLAASFLLFVHLITHGRGMGLGDVKFAILGGMIVGLPLTPIWLLLSFLTGAASGCILILLSKAKMKTKIAFGPFLIVGIFLTFIFGERIMLLL